MLTFLAVDLLTILKTPRGLHVDPVNAVFVLISVLSILFRLQWTPEGRRLVTGASSGEFTLWNGLTFNFETILQVRRSIVPADPC